MKITKKKGEASNTDIDEKIKRCYDIIQAKKGLDIKLLDIRGINSVADYFLICSGTSTTQVQAICDGISKEFKKEGKCRSDIEGYNNARWILIDFWDFIIHIFHEETRRFYNIENLWTDAKRIELEPVSAAAAPATKKKGKV